VLAEPRHGDELEKKGILYAPDYVINAGGLINVNSELEHWSAERAFKKAGEIYGTMLRVFELAKEEKLPTYLAADRLAERRIEMAGKLKRTWI
jgi:leucine dehydrogenase